MLLIASGGALRFWGLGFGLPHDFARPDEEKLIGAALGVFRGDPNPHFFLYPTLFIYAIAAAYSALFGVERLAGAAASRADFLAQAVADPSVLHLTARMIAASAGAATIPVLYMAARELASARAALVSAAFLAVAFLHVRDSHFGVTDVPATLLTLAAFWAASQCMRRGATPARVVVAGTLCGFAASTKYNCALSALPAIAAILIESRTRAPAARRLGLIALLLLCLGAAFLIGTPFALLDRPAFMTEFAIQRRTALGEHHGSILDAARAAVGERGWRHHLRFTLLHGLGLPLLSAALAGAFWLTIERPATAAIVLSFPIAFYIVMGVSLLVYARWMVPIVPFLCLTAGMLVDRIADAAQHAFTNSRRAAAAGLLGLAGLLAGPTLARSVVFDRLVARPDTRILGAGWIESHFPGGATLYQTGAVYGYVEPRPNDRYRLLTFDERRHRFQNASRQAELPDLIIVLDSPLIVFNHVPPELAAILEANYRWVETFKGTITARISRAVYDQQDAFYVPFANLDTVRRPGPDVRIFVRR
jgi:hypothetical protein